MIFFIGHICFFFILKISVYILVLSFCVHLMLYPDLQKN